MEFASPSRSSSSLQLYLRQGSESKGSHSPTIYARVPSKPKKLQSAHYDETTGTWRCKKCGYTYPNPEPHHHQRRAHKKICPGESGEVGWLSHSRGEETEDSQETSNVVDKPPATPETSDSATTQHALGQQDKNAGFQAPHVSDIKFSIHETPSNNEQPRESGIQELGELEGILSDQHAFVVTGKSTEARRKGELDSEPVTEKDHKARADGLGRLLTLNSDFSLPRGFSQDISDFAEISGAPSSDFVPVSDVPASDNKKGRDNNREEPLSHTGQDEGRSLNVGEDVLTADDTLRKGTELALGVHSSSSSAGNEQKDATAQELGVGFDRSEPSLNAAEDDSQGKTADALRKGDESQMITTEDRNAEESSIMGEGFGETETILPAGASDDGALREMEEDIGSEQGNLAFGGDGTDDRSGEELESLQLVRDVGVEEASMDESGSVVHATEEVGGFDGHDETEVVDAKSLQPLSDDAEGVTGTPPSTRSTGPSVSLSSAERNWDDWEHVVSGDDTSGKEKLPPLPQEIDDAGPAVSEDGVPSSQSDDLEDDTAEKNAPTLESRGTAEIGVQPAGLDWTLAFPDVVKNDVDERQPVDSLGRSTSADVQSSPDQDLQELIHGLDQESDKKNKLALRLSAAEANWDDWEDVIKGGPMLMEGLTLRKEGDPESSGDNRTAPIGDVSGVGQGTTESERLRRPERSSPVLESNLDDVKHDDGLESSNGADSNIVDSESSKQAGLVTSVPQKADPLDSGPGPIEGRKEVDDNEEPSRYESGQTGGDNLWEDDWEVVQKKDDPPAGSRRSSPSSEDAHDGELHSEHEYRTGLPKAVKIPLGTRRWADWEDLTNSEYMVLDGPDGESLVFKRTSDAQDKLSTKALGARREASPSAEKPDADGGSPSLRSRQQAPSFNDDKSPSHRSSNGAPPRGVVKSDYLGGADSLKGSEITPRSLPASSPRKSDSEGVAPLVTRRPLIYRGSRHDYASEVEDLDVTSEPPLSQHLHHHNHHEHEAALKYDVEKVLRGQTTYELICPICGALITRKIIIRKKKRRSVGERDSRWRRGTTEITPVADDGNQSPRSDISSEIEDQSGAWKQGIRPCFGYFFSS